MKIQLQLVNVKENKCLLEEFCKMSLPPPPPNCFNGGGGRDVLQKGKKRSLYYLGCKERDCSKNNKAGITTPDPTRTERKSV